MFSEAVKLIMKIKRNPARAPEFKRSYFQFFGSTEVFLEAIPTVLVQTVIMNEKSTILAQGGLGSTFFYADVGKTLYH